VAQGSPEAYTQGSQTPPPRRTAFMRPRLDHLGLAAVVAGSAVLNLHRLAQNGYANTFYSAGVRSMLDSLHNFLFVSFDPGGLITVDKPPLGLWLQVASAKVFGFSPLSLLVPEAVCGVLCVVALYGVMVRRFGAIAALSAALALAVYPSLVAVSRDNGVDSLLILLLILACGAALRAIETGHWRSLLICAVLVGLAFNTKTLAAYLIVPGIGAAYLVCAPGSFVGRAGKLLAAGVLMGIVSFAWIAMVELTPVSKRPFVGSSTNNSELGLTFEYNGFGRVSGEVGGPGNIPAGNGALGSVEPSKPRAVSPHRRPHHVTHRPVIRRHLAPRLPLRAIRPVPSATLPNGRRRHPIAFERPVGPLRLFGEGLGEQGGWMLPFALAGLLALGFAHLRRFTLISRDQTGRAPSVPSGRRDPRLAGLIVLGGWFLLEAVTLSSSKGIVHPYYVSALGPGSAAMIGAGAVALVERRDLRVLLVPLGVAGTVAVQIVLLNREQYLGWFYPLLIAGAVLGMVAVLAHRRLAPPGMAFTLLLLLLAPAAFASTTWQAPVYGTFPAAGPKQATGTGTYGISATSLQTNRLLLEYARTHRPGSRWALLTVASDTAAPLILMGLKAGALAGYSGTDPALDGPGLARLVARGQARYVVLGGAYATRGGNRATIAVQRACTEVPRSRWHGHAFSRYSLVLFDCAGHAPALAGS
jgi:4-amino-4-deoxy-L-arabinose transferase-like glycosyltransferase